MHNWNTTYRTNLITIKSLSGVSHVRISVGILGLKERLLVAPTKNMSFKWKPIEIKWFASMMNIVIQVIINRVRSFYLWPWLKSMFEDVFITSGIPPKHCSRISINSPVGKFCQAFLNNVVIVYINPHLLSFGKFFIF